MRNLDRRALRVAISHGVAVARVAMVLSLLIGWAWPSWADELPTGTSPIEVPPAPAGPEASEPVDERPPGRFFTKDYWGEVWQRDHLSGDWGGLRTKLNDHGVKPQLKFTQFGQGVASGGLYTKGEYGLKLDYILDVDLSKLFGIWPGLFFNFHAESQYGDSILVPAGPALLPNTPLVMPLPNCDCTEVTNLALMQGLWEGEIPLQGDKGAAVLAAGKFNIVDLLTLSFPNFGSGLDGFLNFNALYNAWNYLRFWFPAQYGASLALFNEDRGMPQLSFLVYGQDNVSAKWDISDSFSDGVGMMGLFRVFWDLGDKQGYAAVMATGSTKEYTTVDGIDWEPPFPDGPPLLPTLDRKEGRPWAVTPFVYQEFWRGEGDGKDERKAYVWLTGSVSDREPSFARWSVLGTVEAQGVFASRPLDRMGLAGWYTEFNDTYKDTLRFVGMRPGGLYGVELYYNLAITRWLRLTADLQVAQGVNHRHDIAVIPGARLVLDF